MDKSDHTRLLKEASINDETKFVPCNLERPKTRGRKPKHYPPPSFCKGTAVDVLFPKLETKNASIYKKPTNTGRLLHFDSHVDQSYKKGLLKTMLNRAYRLSSNWNFFTDAFEASNMTFSNLSYQLCGGQCTK